MDLDRIDDVETLRAVAKSYETNWRRAEERLKRLEARLAKLEGSEQLELSKEIAELKRQLATRNKILFGPKSEKRKRGKKKRRSGEPQTGHGPTEQPELELVEQTHELDEADRVCPSCGGALEAWDGQSEDAEVIEVIARRFVRMKHKRQKYRCKCGGCVETAPGPKRLISGGRYSTDFAAHVAVAKYADHLPLERQRRMMKREGLTVTSQALWDQVHAVAKALEPAHERLFEHLRKQPVLGADETPWPMLGKGSKRWQVWALAGPDGVGYKLEPTRSSDAAEALFGDFDGVAITDGYRVYSAVAKRRPDLRLAHCWSHVRRKLIEVEEFDPERVGEALALIEALYDIEREARAGPDVFEARRRLRDERSRAIIGQIQKWALSVEALGESPVRKAVEYIGKLWRGLTLFLDEPEVDIDNNAVERSLRAVVVGRKNHYGSKSRRGTEVAAVLYSLIETAKLNDLDPADYLRQALDAALDEREIPLPHELAQA